MAGPLTKLKWSKWVLAAADKRPLGFPKSRFPLSKKYNWEHVYVKQRLFDFEPCVYEVGVQFPDAAKRKIYVMYFKTQLYMGSRRLLRGVNALSIVRQRSERNNLSNLVRSKLKVFIRRATGTAHEVMAAGKYLGKTYDYAWGWKRRQPRTKKLVKHGVVLS